MHFPFLLPLKSHFLHFEVSRMKFVFPKENHFQKFWLETIFYGTHPLSDVKLDIDTRRPSMYYIFGEMV